jgi:flagellar motor switch protein FliM
MRQLSQDEIDAAFQNRQNKATRGAELTAMPYDFRKPDRIPKSQLRAISFLHENFVRHLTSSLSAYLRSFVSGNLISVEQIPYGAFLDTLPNNTCMLPLTMRPYGGNAILEVSPSLIFPILELLLGGKKITATTENRELTEMERHLLGNLFRLIAQDLEQTWRGMSDVEFRVAPHETGRQLLRTVAPTEAVVAVGMEFCIDDHTGMISLAMPSITVKSMVQKFDQKWSMGGTEPTETEQRHTLNLLRKATVDVEAQVTSKIAIQNLISLKNGSTVLFDHATNCPVSVTFNGNVKCTGQIVMDGGERAFLIEEVLMPQ